MNIQSQKVLPSQKGMVLLIALIMILILTMVGAASIRGTNLQEIMSGNMRDSQVSFQAAEAGLRLAEFAASESSPPPIDSADGFVSELVDGGMATYWKSYNWTNESATEAIDLKIESEDPRYVLEQLDVVYIPGSDGKGVDQQSLEKTAPEIVVYRATSRGVGISDNSVTILQSIFRRQ